VGHDKEMRGVKRNAVGCCNLTACRVNQQGMFRLGLNGTGYTNSTKVNREKRTPRKVARLILGGTKKMKKMPRKHHAQFWVRSSRAQEVPKQEVAREKKRATIPTGGDQENEKAKSRP